MWRRRPSPFRAAAGAHGVLLFAALTFTTCALFAQQPIPSQPPPNEALDPGITTLHVYKTRLQTAALVVDAHGRPATINPNDLRLRLDNGKPFAPSAIHLEADDPLSIAVVIDLSRPYNLTGRLPQALSTLREGPLAATDHLEIYAVDCTVFRVANDASTPDEITRGVEELLHQPGLHPAGRPGTTCASTVRLWDSVAYIVAKLGQQQGRRALLLLSEGLDGSSHQNEETLRVLADRMAVSVFALPYSDHIDGFSAGAISQGGFGRASVSSSMHSTSLNPAEGALAYVADNSGGVVLPLPGRDLSTSFTSFVTLLRHRYILDFNPAPGTLNENAVTTTHTLTATLEHTHLRVRNTGTHAALYGSGILHDANTVSIDGQQGGALKPDAEPATPNLH